MRTAGSSIIAFGLCFIPAASGHASDVFAGKTIEMLVGAAAGGGYDLAGRTVANHIVKHLPGKPAIVVRNLPGASSLIMTNQLYNGAARDGTVVGLMNSNIPLEPRLKLISGDGGNVAFDVMKFNWVGTPVQVPQVLWLWTDAPAKSVSDLKSLKTIVGATFQSADNYNIPVLMNEALGTKFHVISGYRAQTEIFLATERGEVHGNVAGLPNLTVAKPDWVRDKKVRILVQFGTERIAELPDVPTAVELAATPADREMFRFFGAKFNMAYPIALPPNVAPERVAAWRDAFDATMKDPAYVEEATRTGLGVDPVGGAKIAELVADIQRAPQETVDRIRKLISKK